MAGMVKAFDFVEGGRAYACHVEASSRQQGEAWWWFDVKGDRSRYAAFRVDAADTESSVRDRIVSWYEDRAVRRGWLDWRDKGVATAGDATAASAR